MKKEDNLLDKKTFFVHFMTILISLLKQQKNLYQALIEGQNYVHETIKLELGYFIENKQLNSGLQPYLDWASYFQDDQITKICILLYHFENSGFQIEAIQRFLPLLEQLKHSWLEAKIKKEESRLNTFLLFQIISVIILTIAFALGLLSILVVATNGT